jgi:hypothetical protein
LRRFATKKRAKNRRRATRSPPKISAPKKEKSKALQNPTKKRADEVVKPRRHANQTFFKLFKRVDAIPCAARRVAPSSAAKRRR